MGTVFEHLKDFAKGTGEYAKCLNAAGATDEDVKRYVANKIYPACKRARKADLIPVMMQAARKAYADYQVRWTDIDERTAKGQGVRQTAQGTQHIFSYDVTATP